MKHKHNMKITVSGHSYDSIIKTFRVNVIYLILPSSCSVNNKIKYEFTYVSSTYNT